MDDRTYFTGSDARLLFLNHPNRDLNGPFDAAHYVLSAGSSPVHIWNYARQKEGGAPFDDTATGNHVAELQIVMNQRRFEATERQFLETPNVGDVRLEYDTVDGWGQQTTAGYQLLDGKVGSTGEEITLRNATFPTVTLTFKEAVPLAGESQQPENTGPGDILEMGGGSPDTTRVLFWPVDAYFLDGGARTLFHPEASGTPTGSPLSPDQFAAFRRRPKQYVLIGEEHSSVRDWIEYKDFVSAFIELGRPGTDGRQLYAWQNEDLGLGLPIYRKTGRTSASDHTPILEAQ